MKTASRLAPKAVAPARSAIGRERVLQQVETVASAGSTVLIHGETGTGKELIARAIHNLSSRRDRTLVKVNCAAIPTGLLESEMFGHEKGAFTGAIERRIGRFELANHGTIFLDEVEDIPLELLACIRGITIYQFLGVIDHGDELDIPNTSAHNHFSMISEDDPCEFDLIPVTFACDP